MFSSRSHFVLASSCLLLLAFNYACRHTPAQRSGPGPSVQVRTCAHAHNDYENSRPLADALHAKFCSVEVDVFLIEGELRVAHHAPETRPGRTLASLYLEPLRSWVKANRGSIYPGKSEPIILLIDLKTEARETYLAVHQELTRFEELFTRFEADRVVPGPVTAVISGNRPRDLMKSQKLRLAGYDGRMADLDHNPDPAFVTLVSDKWTRFFSWRGEGDFPPEEKIRLREMVKSARSAGVKLRFWKTADTPVMWSELRQAGVDLIGTDNVTGLSVFLQQ